MKICLFTQTLNPKTGAGVFTNSLMDVTRQLDPSLEFSVMTSEDLLKPNIYQILRNWAQIRRQIKESNLIHVLDGYPYGVIACLANIGISKPVIVTAVGSGSIRKLVGHGWKSMLLRWTYRRATLLTAISHYVSFEIKKVLPNLSIEVINHGVDYNFYAKRSESHTNAIVESDYIITQGEFKRRKGYSEILPIIKKVIDIHPTVRYLIIANKDINQLYQNELYGLMDKLGIRDKVIIKSNLKREELREAYQNALLYLTLPKNISGDVEGFGMAIMEATASGTPVVVGRGSGANDAVLDGKSGYLVDGNNQDEVTEKIISLIENKELRKKLSEGASNWAKGNGWDTKIRQYIKLYEKI